MSSIYPINSQPWNTLAVNAGLIDLLEVTGYGESSAVAAASLQIPFTAVSSGVATGLVSLGMTALIQATGTGVATALAVPSWFYYGAIPVLISNWDFTEGVSSGKIRTLNWDQI